MYEKNDKRRVYWLIDLYLAGKIDDKTFCDEFYYSYGLEMDGSTLTKLEREVFDVLSIVTGRFSCYEEDLKLYKVYYSKKDLCYAIIEAKRSFENQKNLMTDPYSY